jgi:hypothetical protein
MVLDLALVVAVDLFPPKLLQPQLLLHLVLEDSELRGEAKRGEDGLLLLEGDGFKRPFDGFWTLLNAVGAIGRLLGLRVLA